MKNKFICVILLAVASLTLHSQGKWDKDLVVKYKMTDKNDKLLNYVEVTKDSVLYEWTDKEKPVKRKFVLDSDLEEKIMKAIESNKVLKFKRSTLAKGSPNIVFTHAKAGKTKEIVFQQNLKAGSKEEKFIKEFMEPILVKVFEYELKSNLK